MSLINSAPPNRRGFFLKEQSISKVASSSLSMLKYFMKGGCNYG